MMTDIDLETQSNALMQKLLAECDGDQYKACFLACALFIQAKDEVTSNLENIFETLKKQPMKRRRGRPPEFLMINKGMGISQVRVTKSVIRNANNKRLGAPQKTYLGGMTTQMMAGRIHYHYFVNRMQNFREATRQILNKFEITYDVRLVKRLADAARRYQEKAVK